MNTTKKHYNNMGLEVYSFPKHKQWAVDQDYIMSLSAEEKQWLSKFNEEFYKNKVTKGSTTDLHSTDTLRKDCYARENAANRDLYAIKATGGYIKSATVAEDGTEISPLDVIACPNTYNEECMVILIDYNKSVIFKQGVK
jgi:hypothetical protein